jgi:hypothetical protein
MDKNRAPRVPEDRHLTYEAPELPAPATAQATPSNDTTN